MVSHVMHSKNFLSTSHETSSSTHTYTCFIKTNLITVLIQLLQWAHWLSRTYNKMHLADSTTGLLEQIWILVQCNRGTICSFSFSILQANLLPLEKWVNTEHQYWASQPFLQVQLNISHPFCRWESPVPQIRWSHCTLPLFCACGRW